MARNALQAVLDRAAQSAAPPTPVVDKPVAEATAPKRPIKAASPKPVAVKAEEQGSYYRPAREGKQLIAGHFPKSVAKQLKLLSVEDDTTVQDLLAEALDLLFVKKGKARIAEIMKGMD